MDALIRPNWHIVILHFPLALLTLGTLVEVFSFLGWRRSSLRTFGRWAILLGAIFAVPVTFTGLYAMSDLLPDGIAGLEKTNPAGAEVVRDHLWMSAVATGAAMGLVVFWIALSDVWRDRFSILFKLGLLLMAALVVIGAHHGGEMVYALHIGPHDQGLANFPTTLPAGKMDELADQALSAVQVHIILAGLGAALACVCLGWSLRAIAQPDDPQYVDETASAQRIAMAFGAQPGTIGNFDERAQLQEQLMVVPTSVSHTRPAPTGRLWLLTAIVLVLAAASGIWYLAVNEGTWEVEPLRRAISLPIEPADPGITRRFVHVVTGLTLVGGSLLLAIAGAAARRSKLLLTIFGVPTVLALALQVWLGILLVMEGPTGKITRFHDPAPATPTPAAAVKNEH